jgi:hypothetical protein
MQDGGASGVGRQQGDTMTVGRRRPQLAGLALAALAAFVAACAAGPVATPSGPTASPRPTPTPIGSPRPSDLPSLEACPNFVEVVETGPLPGDDGTEDGPLAREQARISADVDAAVAYGARFPDEFGSVRYENGPRVRLVIGFTSHIAEHCAALRELLEYPDEFEIIRQPATEAQLMAAMDEIVEMARPSLQGVGLAAEVIHVTLRADGEPFAAEILEAYGDLVEITVGMLPYPNRFAGPAGCGGEALAVSDAPLELVVDLEADAIKPGADFHGTVEIANTGPAPFDFQSGPTQTAAVYLPGADSPVGFFTGGMDAIGYGATIEPGASITLDVIGGTASCDPGLGWALPPGAYEVRVHVAVYTMVDNGPTEVAYVVSPPVPLTIEP